jgi:hypothetical protein
MEDDAAFWDNVVSGLLQWRQSHKRSRLKTQAQPGALHLIIGTFWNDKVIQEK